MMQKVLLKHAPNIDSAALFRQLPSNDLFDKNITFTTDSSSSYDWLVVLHHSAIQKILNVKIPKSRCVYVSMEPSESLCSISSEFINQFGTVIGSDNKIVHDNLVKLNVHNWWVGLEVQLSSGGHSIKYNGFADYDYYSRDTEFKKINKVSVINSSKIIFPGHKDREKLIECLSNSSISSSLDIYGRNFKTLQDKTEAIQPYMYHLVIENMYESDYWSEKLADAFLLNSMPIYYGCPNIVEYFPSDSLIHVDKLDPSYIEKVVADAINSNQFKQSATARLTAKNLILNKYNIFNILSDICQRGEDVSGECLIMPNTYFSKGRLYYYAKSIFKNLFYRANVDGA